MEVQPAPVCRQAVVEPQKIIDGLRLRPDHVRGGHADVAKAGGQRHLFFRRVLRDMQGQRFQAQGHIVLAPGRHDDIRADRAGQAIFFVLSDRLSALALVQGVRRAVPAHGKAVQKAMRFLAQVHIPDRHGLQGAVRGQTLPKGLEGLR